MTPKEAFKRLTDSIDVYDESIGLTKNELWSLGMQPFDKDDAGRELWLFPNTFYEHIPAGFPIVYIDFRRGEFMPNVTDNDTRFGFLAFGILGKVKQ